MKKSLKKVCAITMIGTLLAGGVPIYQGLAASKKLKVNSKNITLYVGQTKTLSANMVVSFKTSNKKIVSLKNVKKKKCTLTAKKKGSCTITVKAKKQKAIKVKVKVQKVTTKPVPKPTTNVVDKMPTRIPDITQTPVASTIVPDTTQESEKPAATIQAVTDPAITMLPQETSSAVVPQITPSGVLPQPTKTLTPEEKEELNDATIEPMPTINETLAPQETDGISVTPTVETLEPKKTVSPAAVTTKPEPTATPTEPTATPVQTTIVPSATPAIMLPEDADTMGGKVNSLGYRLSKLLAQTDEKDGNRIISSYSIMMALTMLDNAADEETKAEIEKILGITDLDAWNKEFSQHLKNNCNDTIQNHDANEKEESEEDIYPYRDPRFEPELSSANSFWYNDSQFFFDSKVQKDYMGQLEKNYFADCRPLDFSNANRNAKEDINQWVEEKTNQKIKNLLTEDLKKYETQAVLVNTLYFNGCWSNLFNKELTSKKEFYGKNKTTTVDMMYQSEEHYSYYEQGDIMGVELPFYGDSNLVMDVITSKEKSKDGVSSYEKMSDTEKNQFYQSLGNSKEKMVNLHLPKFKLEYGSVDITDQLKKLGMKQAFDGKFANFPGIRGENPDNVYVDSVIHKAVIEVGETGATAAAATAILMNATATNPENRPTPIDFNVNRPFVFAIRDKSTNMIYFMGQIENL